MFTLLIVDDEPLIRRGLKNQIPWPSIGVGAVLDAASGEQALALMAQGAPDVMITDINMREMTGLQLIERTNELHPSVDIIVLTGYDDFEYARSCLRMRVKDFLLKPVDEDQLLALVAKLKRQRDDDRTAPGAFSAEYESIKQHVAAGLDDAEQVHALMERLDRQARECAISDDQLRRCCFELVALCQFSHATDAPGGKLDGAMAALEHLDRAGCVAFARDFLARQCGVDVGHEIVERAKRLIAEQLGQDVTVASLGASLYITPAYLSRLFKRATGEGCNEYIVRKRIEQAKGLLQGTNLKVNQIAQRVGYRDTNYFSMAFKKWAGVSPMEFRENARK